MIKFMGRIKPFTWFILASFLCVMLGINPQTAEAAAPTITGVSSRYVPAGGGTIDIYGTNLGDVSSVRIRIGTESLSLPIVEPHSSFLVVQVPAHDVDPNGSKQVDSLTVINSSGSYTISNPFQYIAAPIISHSYPFTLVSKYDENSNPSQDPADRKKYLKIEGTYLDWVSTVYLKNGSGQILSFSGTSLLRDASDGGIYFDITSVFQVNNPPVQVKLMNLAGDTCNWTNSDYYYAPVPFVNTFYPNPQNIYEGSTLNISGANFFNVDKDNTRVYVAGREATLTSVSNNNIVLTVPAPEVGNNNLIIEVWDSGVRRAVAVYENAVNVQAVPSGVVVEQVLPNHGSPAGGNEVIVVGEKFDQTMTVAFEIGGQTFVVTGSDCTSVAPPAYLPSTKTAFKVKVPSSQGRTGGARVKIVFRSDPSVVLDSEPNLYFYTTASQYLDLQGVSPTSAPFDTPTPVQVQGMYFTMFRRTDSQKTVELPDGTLRTIDNVNSISIGDQGVTEFKIYETIPNYYQGHDFRITRSIIVDMGGSRASIKEIQTVGNVQYMIGETGIYGLGNLVSQTVNVEVNISEQTHYWDGSAWVGCVDETYYPLNEVDTLTGAFTYNRTYPDPEIESITPSFGPNLVKNQVVITGFNFYEGLTVTFGGQPASVVSLTDGAWVTGKGPRKYLTVEAPTSSTCGEVQVVITNSDGKSVSTSFTYVSTPAVTSISPAVGPLSGGNYITVSGSQFTYGAGVVIGDKVVCNADSEAAISSLMANDEFKQAVFGSTATVSVVVDDSFRVLAGDGSELQSFNPNPDGVKIILKVPQGTTAGQKDVYVINADRGWVKKEKGYTYKVLAGTVPVINTITPQEGKVEGGETVVISGTGFLNTPYSSSSGFGVLVTIDGAVATVSSISDANTRLTIKTPPGTRVEEWVPVQVLNVSPDGIQMAEVSEGFKYHRILTLPKINSFAPTHGQAGTVVTIFGSDFAVDPNTKVLFGSQELSQAGNGVTVINSGTITFPVPGTDSGGNALQPGLYSVGVKNPDTGTAQGKTQFNLQVPASHPRIEDVDGDGIAIKPACGTKYGGTDLVIEGYDFYEGLEVFIGGVAATSVQIQFLEFDETLGVWSRCVVRCKTPALPEGQDLGAKDVMVLNPDGGVALAAGGFTYVSPSSNPVISSITPGQGPSAGNQLVLIQGSDFRVTRDADGNITEWPVVTFGGFEAAVVKDNTLTQSQGKSLKVYTPAHSGGGAVDVTIVNPDYAAYTKTKAYTYVVSKPTITSITPDNIANKKMATYKTIKGTGFLPLQTFQGQERRTEAFLRYPATGTAVREIHITDGTTSIRISDTETQTVSNIEIISETEIRLVLPALADSDPIGEWCLRLLNPDGGYVDKVIKYISVDPGDLPSVTLPLVPNQGTTKGGTLVTINGARFQTGVKVSIGGKECPSVTRNDTGTQLIVETPPGSAGPADVVVMNPDGGQVYLTGAFTYITPESEPTILKVTPNEGPAKGGTEVTITGTNFRDGVKVYFDTTEITGVERDANNPTEILHLITPAHALGSVDVIVRNPDYGEACLNNGFTYKGAPELEEGAFTAEVVGKSAIKLSWPQVPGASEYEIFISIGDDDHWTFLASSTGTSYYFKKVKAASYYFRLRTVNDEGTSNTIKATPYPLTVADEDLADKTPTASINEGSDQVAFTQGRLKVTIGKDIVYVSGTVYPVVLTPEQQKAAGVEVLIPTYGVDRVPDKTVLIETDNFRFDIPLRALNTFEYQKYKKDSDCYVRLSLFPAAPGRLEAASANSGKQAVTGFEVGASIQQAHRSDAMSYFNQDLHVFWPGRGQVLPQIMTRDPISGKWTAANSALDSSTGWYNVGVRKPEQFVFFVPRRMR